MSGIKRTRIIMEQFAKEIEDSLICNEVLAPEILPRVYYVYNKRDHMKLNGPFEGSQIIISKVKAEEQYDSNIQKLKTAHYYLSKTVGLYGQDNSLPMAVLSDISKKIEYLVDERQRFLQFIQKE